MQTLFPEYNLQPLNRLPQDSNLGMEEKEEQKRTPMAGKRHALLYNTVKKMFPNMEVHSNYKFSKEAGRLSKGMKLSVFVPQLSLAFEYHGNQHFAPQTILGSTSALSIKAGKKRSSCSEHNITLIEVPYWWDGFEKSLKATIHMHRPELVELQENEAPIPENPPFEQLVKGKPILRRCAEWDSKDDPTNW